MRISEYCLATGSYDNVHRTIEQYIKDWRQPFWSVLSSETEHSKKSYYTQAMVKYEEETNKSI